MITPAVLAVSYEPHTRHVVGDAFKQLHDHHFWRDDYRLVCDRNTRCGDIVLHSDAKFCYTEFVIDIVSPKGYDGWWGGSVSYLQWPDDPAIYQTRWYHSPEEVAALIDKNLRRLSRKFTKELATP